MLIGTAWVKLFTGQPGNGKGYNVCLQIAEVLGKGGHVSGNVDIVRPGMVALVRKFYGVTPDLDRQYNYLDSDDKIHNFQRNTPSGTPDCPTLVVIDEADLYWDAKKHAESAKREEEMFHFLKLCRHESTMVILITQSPENLNARMRRLAEVWDFRDMSRLTFLGWKPWKHWFVCIKRPPKGKGALERKWVRRDQAVFAAYKSSQFRGTVQRKGEAGRVKLEKASPLAGWRSVLARWWRRILLIGLVLFLVYRCNAPAPVYGDHSQPAKDAKPAPRVISTYEKQPAVSSASAAAPGTPPALAGTFSGPDGQIYTLPPPHVVVVRELGYQKRNRRITSFTLAAPPYPRPEVLRIGDWSSVLNLQVTAVAWLDNEPAIIDENGNTLRIVVGRSHFFPVSGAGAGPGGGAPPPGVPPVSPGGQ